MWCSIHVAAQWRTHGGGGVMGFEPRPLADFFNFIWVSQYNIFLQTISRLLIK